MYLRCLKAQFISIKMIVDVTKLENSQIEIDLSIKPEEIDMESEFVTAKQAVEFDGKLDNQENWTLIGGNIRAELEVACGRCVEPVDNPVDLQFETAFIRAENFTEERETELEVKGLDVSLFEGNEINLVEVAQEQIVTSLPPQVLCKEDCKGLCTECGANKNLRACKCGEAEVDSRWAALKDIKKDT